MASFENALLFYVLITENRRIRISSLADRMACSERTIYRLITTASKYIPLRLEEGVVIYEGRGHRRTA